MKFFRMILIAGEVLLVILLLLGIVFKVAECEKKDKSLNWMMNNKKNYYIVVLSDNNFK